MALVEKDDLEDGTSDKFGQEVSVGTPKSAQVETKLERDTTGPTKEGVGNFETALLEKDDHEELGKKGSENTNKPGSYEDGGSDKLIAEQIVGTNGLTTEVVDSPDAA